MSICPGIAGTNVLNGGKIGSTKHCESPPTGWVKYNTDASKSMVTQDTAISYVSRDNRGRIIIQMEGRWETF